MCKLTTRHSMNFFGCSSKHCRSNMLADKANIARKHFFENLAPQYSEAALKEELEYMKNVEEWPLPNPADIEKYIMTDEDRIYSIGTTPAPLEDQVVPRFYRVLNVLPSRIRNLVAYAILQLDSTDFFQLM